MGAFRSLAGKFGVLDKYYTRWGNIFFAVVSLMIMLFVMFFGYNVGLSDQSDFGRVMNASSLRHYIHDRAFIFVDRYEIILEGTSVSSNIFRILFSADGLRNYPSIHVLFVRLSVIANLLFNHMTGVDLSIFRIGILGAATALVYAGLLFWLFGQLRLKNIFADIAAKALIIFVACDIGYVGYFNSFYSESMQILAMLMLVVTVARIIKGKTEVFDYALLVLAAVLYGWSKFANLPIAFLVILAAGAVVIVVNIKRPAGYFTKIALTALIGVVPLLLVYSNIPSWMEIDTNFNSVFFGIVKDTDYATTTQHLEALGLNPDMAYFSSQNRYVAGVARQFYEIGFEEEFAELSKFDLLWFYLRRPSLFAEGITMRIAHSGQIRPWYLANYNFAQMEQSGRFSAWTALRTRMGFDTVLGNIVLWTAFAWIFAAMSWHKKHGKKLTVLLLLAVVGSGAYSLAIQMVANGEADMAKQMFIYIQIVDIVFGFIFVAGLYHIAKTKKLFKPVPVAAIICLSALLLPAAVSGAHNLAPMRVVDMQTATRGDIVSFGSFQGEEILWRVVGETEYALQLVAARNVAYLPFDNDGSNFWVNASIRHWLNGEFLAEAFVDSAPLILEQYRHLILTNRTMQYATMGDREFYAFHIPAYAFRGVERAFRMPVYDRVRLPCASIMQQLVEGGHRINGGYWLEIPRFLDGSFVRYVTGDGFVSLRPASSAIGVRPVIEVGRN